MFIQYTHTQTVTGLAPATNYTVYIAVRSNRLISTLVAITDVLTPDTTAPTFSGVGPIASLAQDTSHFTLRLPVRVNEASQVNYAVFRWV